MQNSRTPHCTVKSNTATRIQYPCAIIQTIRLYRHQHSSIYSMFIHSSSYLSINYGSPSFQGPYVIVTLLRKGKVLEKKRTQPCKEGLDPVWNEPFVFDWKNDNTDETGYKFVFEIKNSDMVLPDKRLGVVEICQHDSEHWNEMMEKKNYARAMCHKITWNRDRGQLFERWIALSTG